MVMASDAYVCGTPSLQGTFIFQRRKIKLRQFRAVLKATKLTQTEWRSLTGCFNIQSAAPSIPLLLYPLQRELLWAMDGPRTLSEMTSTRADVSKSLGHIFELHQDNPGITLEDTLREWSSSLCTGRALACCRIILPTEKCKVPWTVILLPAWKHWKSTYLNGVAYRAPGWLSQRSSWLLILGL